MPGLPFRSSLEPHLDFITHERLKRISWKAIAQSIRDKGTACTPQGVQDYFKRQRKRHHLPLGFEPPKQPEVHTKKEEQPTAYGALRRQANTQTQREADPAWGDLDVGDKPLI